MTAPTQSSAQKMIGATLLLERPAEIDYRRMIERVGKALEIDPKVADEPHLGGAFAIERDGKVQKIDPKLADEPKSGGAFMLPAGGDVIMGMKLDLPYPEPLDRLAAHAYWWPDAMRDIARNTAHLMVYCPWLKFSRFQAHIRHLILVRELVEQLPVIGVLWGSVLVPSATFKGEFAAAQQSGVAFPLWVLVQFSQQPNGNILVSTLGMHAFEQMEIETESARPLDQTVDLVRKFGSYILTQGPVVRDGETIGFSAEQRIKVRHVRSFRPDTNGNVYWLELTDTPTVRRP